MKKFIFLVALLLSSNQALADDYRQLTKNFLENRYQVAKLSTEGMEEESYKDIAFHDAMDSLNFTYPDCKKYFFLTKEYYNIAEVKDYNNWLEQATDAIEFLRIRCAYND